MGGGGCVVKVLGTWTSMCRGGCVGPGDIIEESSICWLWLVVPISLSSNV